MNFNGKKTKVELSFSSHVGVVLSALFALYAACLRAQCLKVNARKTRELRFEPVTARLEVPTLPMCNAAPLCPIRITDRKCKKN